MNREMGVSSDVRPRRALMALTVVAGAAALLQAAVAAWARHGLTEVESIIATHAVMLASGEGLYYDLNSYPFTVSPYGPVFYGLEALGVLAGLPALAVGRLVSGLALAAAVLLIYRILRTLCDDRWSPWAGALLALSTGNLVGWGVTGQSDMPALAFSLAAIERYVTWRETYVGVGVSRALVWAGVWIALAIFTKQSFLAAGAAICLGLLLEDRRVALRFIPALGAAGLACAALLTWATEGRFFANALLANLNPFSWEKLGDQLHFFVLTSAGLLVAAAPGFLGRVRRARPLLLYVACASAMFLLTAAKVGSDLNYQIEPVAAWILFAGWTLGRLDFFRKTAGGDRGWTPLLQLPLLLYLVMGWGVGLKVALERVAREDMRRAQQTALEPWLASGKRVLSVEADPLLQTGRAMEVEPLIYTLLVEAGVTDERRVMADLEEERFDAVLLYHDPSETRAADVPAELPRLPEAQLAVIAERYRLAERVPGPLADGLFVFEPKGEGHAAIR